MRKSDLHFLPSIIRDDFVLVTAVLLSQHQSVKSGREAQDLKMEENTASSTFRASPQPRHAGPSIQVPPGMSKSAAKKLARKEKLEATKHERRAAERLKKKENRRARFLVTQKSSADQTDPANKRRVSASSSAEVAERKRPKPGGEGAEGGKEYFDARLVIDCGFDELMAEKEVSSMTQQLMYLYSANRNAKVPFGEVILTGQDRPEDCLQDVDTGQLSLIPARTARTEPDSAESSSSSGRIEYNRIGQAMDGKLRGVWRRWKRVTIYPHGGIESLLSPKSQANAEPTSSESATDIASTSLSNRHFAPEETRQALHRIPLSDAIYLTADTDDTLTSLEPGKTYIIGGIVDKNRYKGLCRAKADRLGIRAAKLPLSHEMMHAVERSLVAQGESIQDGGEENKDQEEVGKGFVGRKVLTVNQVVEILVAWTETRDWVKALEKALPRRKLKQRGPAAKFACAQEGAATSEVEENEDKVRNGL